MPTKSKSKSGYVDKTLKMLLAGPAARIQGAPKVWSVVYTNQAIGEFFMRITALLPKDTDSVLTFPENDITDLASFKKQFGVGPKRGEPRVILTNSLSLLASFVVTKRRVIFNYVQFERWPGSKKEVVTIDSSPNLMDLELPQQVWTEQVGLALEDVYWDRRP